MKIIGLSGTNGAGKDLVGEILAADHGYLFVSFTDMLREECRRRGLPVERENLRAISAEWRKEFGPGVILDKIIDIHGDALARSRGLVVASLRNPGEADSVHERDGLVFWIDADPEVRYGRISAGRGRSEDNKTYEEFLAEERAEMYNTSNDATALNTSAVKDRSDIFIENNGNDIEAFKLEVAKILRQYNLI